MTKVKKLDENALLKIIEEEFGKMKDLEDEAKKETEEVEASDLADALVQKVDHMKALKIKESKLIKVYQEAKTAILETRKQMARLKVKK